MNYQINKFMCPICGKETIPVARPKGSQRKSMHRKWLYCPWCNKTVNTYECRNYEELVAFKSAFESGEITKAYEEEMATLDPKYRH